MTMNTTKTCDACGMELPASETGSWAYLSIRWFSRPPKNYDLCIECSPKDCDAADLDMLETLVCSSHRAEVPK